VDLPPPNFFILFCNSSDTCLPLLRLKSPAFSGNATILPPHFGVTSATSCKYFHNFPALILDEFPGGYIPCRPPCLASDSKNSSRALAFGVILRILPY